MFDDKKWSAIEPQIYALPGGKSLCKNVREKDKGWERVGEAFANCSYFPKSEFNYLLVLVKFNKNNFRFDVRWPLTFAAFYRFNTGGSVDQECIDFLIAADLWEQALKVIPEFSRIEGVSSWAEGFIQHQTTFKHTFPRDEVVINPSLDALHKKLQYVEDLDKDYNVFGASQHKYISTPLSERVLEQVEDELNCQIPQDFRQFLAEVGYGAGPYYGIYGPNEIVGDLRGIKIGAYGNHIRIPEASKPFPLTCAQANECFNIMSERKQAVFEVDWPTDGYIPISQEGDGYQTCLITAGELMGSIWSYGSGIFYINRSWPESWNLAPRPPGILRFHFYDRRYAWEQALSPLPTFLEWYNAWLDQCLSDLELLYKKPEPSRPAPSKHRSSISQLFDRFKKP